MDMLKSIFILFAIVNPIGSIPIFLQLTNNMSLEQRQKTFRTGILASGIILFIFILAGERILTNFFQINLSDLMAAGGLLLLIIAIDHLTFGKLISGVLSSEQQDAHHIGAVPIACPILAGPGAMITVLVTFSEYGFITALVSIVVVLGITGLIFKFIDKIYGFLGKIVCTVLSKILCLFIAAIGIRLLMQGLSQYFSE
ncbi:MAG: MarC family protein [Candidatus Omnitrophica bacterium]|nr:MarC family protein [Candidatus Omnitrophota bacterium]